MATKPQAPFDLAPEMRFIGTDGARDDLVKALVEEVVTDHLKWRQLFAPRTGARRGFIPVSPTLRRNLDELVQRLHRSAPFHSPYYIAHMASDVMTPSVVGYLAGLLYNQNNIAKEKSPSTTPLELEVAAQLATMIGFDPKRAWGHLTSGGTVANFEGLWAARNLKAFPFAARDLATRHSIAFRVRLPEGATEDIRKLSPVELLNLPIPEIMRMRARLEELVGRRAVTTTLATIGPAGEGLVSLGDQGVTSIGAILLPGTKHYSWLKIAEALGVGRASLRFVEVDEHMRMRPRALAQRIHECRDAGEAVLAAVAVVGSTAEGAVDPVEEVVRIQQREAKKGTPFYIHADAAYGGYARAMMLTPQGRLLSPRQVRASMRPFRMRDFPDNKVMRALAALPACDSVTVDPHKFGYVPVPAGAVLFREGEIRGVLATPRPYFGRGEEDWRENPPSSIGGFILEGTKPGAAAASVWLAHRVVPLHQHGYGRLVARAAWGAHEVASAVRSLDRMRVKVGRRTLAVRLKLLTDPALNILCFGAKIAGDPSLEKMNALNRALFRKFSIEEVGTTPGRFILSSTTLTRDEYGDAPAPFLRSLGISAAEWQSTRALFLLRSVVQSPAFADSGLDREFAGALRAAVQEVVGEKLTRR